MAKKNVPPLIVETKQDSSNLLYLSVIEYKRKTYLAVIDNISGSEISAFVLDNAEAENVDIDWFLSTATKWFYQSSERYPLSFEFNKLEATSKVLPILKTFKIDHISRLIGKVFSYELDVKPNVKRKKVSNISGGIEVMLKRKSNVYSIRC